MKIVDFWCGLGFAALGGWALVTALGFDKSSSTYPSILAAALLGLSLLLMIQSLRAASPKLANAEGARVLLPGPGLEIGGWCLWAVGLWLGAGYLIASFLAAAVLIVAFAMFYLIFNVPLPELEVIRDLLGS
jgi:hypothetical protein